MGHKFCDKWIRTRLLASLGGVAARFYPGVAGGLAGVLLGAAPQAARAFNIYDGSQSGNNLEVNLTTTVSYTGFERVSNPSKQLIGPGNANGSEGDLNFQHGLVGNQFEILPILDVKDGDYGAHLSGEAYLNTVYLQRTQNDQPGTFNPISTDYKHFTSATRNVDGENARLLDAFVFGQHTFADHEQVSLKVGRQTLLWGQSLFFAGNGIAAGQAPIDIITAQNLANPEAQQIFLPVGQVVLTYRPGIGDLTFQGYYQFEYQHDVFQGVGAYFNSSDILDKGGQRVIAAPGVYFLRQKDRTPEHQNGQFGLSVQDAFGNYDVGLFGLRFDAKAPEVYAIPGQNFLEPTPGGIVVGGYQLVYPRDTYIFGSSVSTTVGPVNVAGEVSGRTHMPLVAGFGISTPANPGNANSDPLFPVGDTVAAQASGIYVSPGLPLDPGGVTVDGEVEFNHVVKVTQNKAALAPGRQASAAAFEVVMTPTYNNVLPSLQLTFPIGITYNVLGRSQIDQSMQHGTGAVTFGVTATYQNTWVAGLTYKDFFGKPDAVYNGLADRSYVSLNLQHTF